jgi:hypothetical protein
MQLRPYAVSMAGARYRHARTGLGLRVRSWVALLVVVGGVGAATGYAVLNRGARRDLALAEEPDPAA